MTPGATWAAAAQSAEDLKQLLVRRELLTNWQIERLLKGETQGFFYGNYKVLYYVGAGTFARVYRAAHKVTGEVRNQGPAQASL